MKQKNVPAERKGEFGVGDVWTWVAVDADSILVVSYMLGLRDAGYATEFTQDVASRLANRIQHKAENLAANLALLYMYNNFCRVHQTLRVTPVMQAGITDHVWEIEELVGLLESEEQAAIARGEMKRGKYKAKVRIQTNSLPNTAFMP